ncbi:MAG: hypothetical protein LBF44_00395, partial [Holosporaceae bacterium]|nr:hypothetical protein [Holosporaceae bacterium]
MCISKSSDRKLVIMFVAGSFISKTLDRNWEKTSRQRHIPHEPESVTHINVYALLERSFRLLN